MCLLLSSALRIHLVCFIPIAPCSGILCQWNHSVCAGSFDLTRCSVHLCGSKHLHIMSSCCWVMPYHMIEHTLDLTLYHLLLPLWSGTNNIAMASIACIYFRFSLSSQELRRCVETANPPLPVPRSVTCTIGVDSFSMALVALVSRCFTCVSLVPDQVSSQGRTSQAGCIHALGNSKRQHSRGFSFTPVETLLHV